MLPLQEDFSNINEFYAEVIQMGDAVVMVEEPMGTSGIVELLLRKLCTRQGLDWLNQLGQNSATIQRFVAYIGRLSDQVGRLSALPGIQHGGAARAPDASRGQTHGPRAECNFTTRA